MRAGDHPTGDPGARPSSGDDRPPGDDAAGDESLVAAARRGDRRGFEELFRRHHRAVYRTLVGITGRPEDAEDAVQSAFVKAFLHLDQFEGAARFSTWLTRIAINEGLGRLRERGRLEPLETPAEDEDADVMPRNLRAWEDNPEILHSRAEARDLVERELLRLPQKYRLAVMLRDIQQLSAEDAAQALGLGVPTLKTHLLRGRLMLRDALAPHFAVARRPPAAGRGPS